MQNVTEAVFRLPSNMIGNSDDETSFPHKSSLTDRKVAKIHKAFANNLSTEIKLQKTELSNMI